jgi:hypothetical protein
LKVESAKILRTILEEEGLLMRLPANEGKCLIAFSPHAIEAILMIELLFVELFVVDDVDVADEINTCKIIYQVRI